MTRDFIPFDRLPPLIESFLIRGHIDRYSPATLANHHYLVWLDNKQGWEHLDRVDAPIDQPDHVQPPTKAQVTAMLAAAKKTRNPLRDEAILTVFLDTGMRLSELCALTVGDVDIEAEVILIRDGKGVSAGRVVSGATANAPSGSTSRRNAARQTRANRCSCPNGASMHERMP